MEGIKHSHGHHQRQVQELVHLHQLQEAYGGVESQSELRIQSGQTDSLQRDTGGVSLRA